MHWQGGLDCASFHPHHRRWTNHTASGQASLMWINTTVQDRRAAMKITLTGDVMLGRLVDQYVIRNRSVRPEALWGDVLPVMLGADCRLINLECVISSHGEEWHPTTKAFHFRARPRTIEFLSAAKINGVTLANNHVLDYSPEALLDCFKLLDQAGIKRTGAGATTDEAFAPLVLDLPESYVAVVALTDNEPEWEATKTKPGVNYVWYGDRGLREPYRSRLTQAMLSARQQAHLVIVSAHVGPNWSAPPKEIQALAHDLRSEIVDVRLPLCRLWRKRVYQPSRLAREEESPYYGVTLYWTMSRYCG